MRVYLPGELRAVEKVEVSFANWVQLAGLRVEEGPESIHLYLHWRLLRKTVRPWRCFVHVMAGDERVSSLDHALLGGKPEVRRWEAGDEGYEKLDHWWKRRPEALDLRLGLYDPVVNVRCPVVRSTLPVEDDCTAVVAGRSGPGEYAVRFAERPLVPCGVEFEEGLELTAYAASRWEGLVWLRLKWTLRGKPKWRLRFFGHGAAEATNESATLGQFDQELVLERRGPATEIEQNMVARIGRGARWLRGGVCTEPELVRVGIVRGKGKWDVEERCCFWELGV